MPGGIYVLKENAELVEMSEQAYDSEALLQELLAKYPSLLAGDQMNPAAPRRWLLVRREAGVPAQDNGIDRWAVDHLFLDQDAVPTLVEVKRSSDTRIRREVVGQMLDYAANAVVYWPVETIRSAFETRCSHEGVDSSTLLGEHIGPDRTAEDFWLAVKTNLAAGRIRMAFVADKIPPELQRIVEFLNGQTDPAEVLAVEIRQYVGASLKTLVPRVIGQTAEAQQRKRGPTSEARQWDEASFFEELERKKGYTAASVGREMLGWAKSRGLRIWWGKGKVDGSFYPMFDHDGRSYYTVAVWTYGNLTIPFQGMRSTTPFDDKAKLQELLERLNAIPGISIPPDGIARFPSIPLLTLQDTSVRAQFLAAFDWVIDQAVGS